MYRLVNLAAAIIAGIFLAAVWTSKGGLSAHLAATGVVLVCWVCVALCVAAAKDID